MIYPHLFLVKDEKDRTIRYVVKIANSHFCFYKSDWMCDDSLPPGKTLRVDVDVSRESYSFDVKDPDDHQSALLAENEAWDLIRRWWKHQRPAIEQLNFRDPENYF